MNKVLIIARYFGSRIPGLLKNLPEFGWQPVLLTTSLPLDSGIPTDISVIESGSRKEGYFAPASGRSIFDRILACGGEIVNYPDSYKGWKNPATRAANELLKTEKIDAIISSSSPVTSHLIARELIRKHRIPWIADLRDPWSQNHNYYYSSLRKKFDKRLELKTLAEADTLVTVSQPWADKLAVLHKGKTVAAITNGFDAEQMKAVSPGMKPGFTITYTGNIYRGKQNPGRLFSALRDLIAEDSIDKADIKVRFYGPRLDWLEKEIIDHTLSDIVKQYGMVSPQESIEKQKESQLLLLLDWEDSTEKGVCPLKTFEYLGAQRPILAIGGVERNVVDLVLDRTKAGIHAITNKNISEALKHFYQEYKQMEQLPYHGITEEINKYTQRRMTGEFVEILQRFVE